MAKMIGEYEFAEKSPYDEYDILDADGCIIAQTSLEEGELVCRVPMYIDDWNGPVVWSKRLGESYLADEDLQDIADALREYLALP